MNETVLSTSYVLSFDSELEVTVYYIKDEDGCYVRVNNSEDYELLWEGVVPELFVELLEQSDKTTELTSYEL